MRPINILLIEDDQLDIMDVKRSLNRMNVIFHLEIANNGEEAVKILRGETAFGLKVLPDVVLIDINMPKMNGFEFLEVIQVNHQWKQLKCFILTTSDEKVDRNAASALKISGYIVKPLKLNSSSSMDAFNLMIDLLNFKSLDC